LQTDAPFVAFGELLLRYSAPGAETLLQSPVLNVCAGGAEANVAVNLAQLGHVSRMVSIAPDNALGRATRDALRRYGVDTTGVSFTPGRMGIYYLIPGAIWRPPEVLYDRADSAFALAAADAIDWDVQLNGAGWFHVSGITAALGANAAEAALRALKAARAAGLKISFDCNYRPKLWAAWSGDAPTILREIASYADVIFGDHRDAGVIFGKTFEGDGARAAGIKALFDAFPNLKRVACTHRLQHTVDHHDLSGCLFARDASWTTKPIALWPIVDRIGGGDAFAAGILHGLIRGWDDQKTLDFGTASGGLKHALPGDFNLVSEDDILAAMSVEAVDVRR